LARGIDIPGVSLIINANVPRIQRQGDNKEDNSQLLDPVTYIHRVGRTGRFNLRGAALTLYKEAQHDKRKEKDEQLEEILTQYLIEFEGKDTNIRIPDKIKDKNKRDEYVKAEKEKIIKKFVDEFGEKLKIKKFNNKEFLETIKEIKKFNDNVEKE
jgi:superfamily II DNA/RNA helicase